MHLTWVMKDKANFFIVNTARDGRVDRKLISKETERSTTVFKREWRRRREREERRTISSHLISA